MSETEIVISGIGGIFPQSPNLVEFGKNLLANKYLPESCNRWKYDDSLGIPNTCGEAPYAHFDDVFFGINKRLAQCIDPISKVGYERSFEAIVDAGYNPNALKGSATGVFATGAINEFEQKIVFIRPRDDGYSVMGLSRAMFANRISYFFDLNGPSCALDNSSAAVHLALQKAREAILEEKCVGALVVATCISRYPETSVLLKRLGFISNDTLTRSFDAEGSGSVRSDGAVAFYLQRGDLAKRCYAKVLAAGSDYVGPRSRIDITLPSPLGMERFLSNLYRSNSIDPKRIAYLEGDGSANQIRDTSELNAIDAALIREAGRQVSLPIGSVKSNLGFVDTVAGHAAVCKAILAMESGIIPATINYKKPNANAHGLLEGRIKVVDSNTPLQLAEDSVVAVNTLGLGGGLIGHTVLQANPRKQQQPEDAAQHLPRLVVISARTEEFVRVVASKIQAFPFNTNLYRLVQDVFSSNIKNYDYRGYVFCPPYENEALQVQLMEKRHVWFVYSGMGSQWAGMGTALMQLPIFADTIERLHAVLLLKGLNLKEIITDSGVTAFDNIDKSFVGITACQVALTNVLHALGLVPAGIIGHSVGELGCAYADGCLTEEQAVLAACARGAASNEATLIKGMMAAIGLSYADVKDRLPPTIDVACHNSDSSCTLSGPAENVKEFVKQLSGEGVFARAVNVSDIAYHSRYIQPAAPFLRKYLETVIPEPKRRSSKWVTTSVPLHLRDTEEALFCSAGYQTNNLLSPVLFEEGLKEIPENSMLIEVAPHGLLQAILKRALPDQMHVPLTQRGHSDPIRFLLDAVGKMSFGGAEPQVSALYPDVSFPVPRGTPPLSQLVSWIRDESNYCDRYKEIMDEVPPIFETSIDTPYMKLNQCRIYPLSEQLVFAWMSLSKAVTEPLGSYPVRFDDIYINHWSTIPREGTETLQAVCMPSMQEVVLQQVCQNEEDKPLELLRCRLAILDSECVSMPDLPAASGLQKSLTISREDLYEHLEAHGLAYSSKYHTINEIHMAEQEWMVNVAFNGSWPSFVEAIVQVFLIRDIEDGKEVHLPKTIQRLEIDPVHFMKNSVVTLRFHIRSGILQGAGIYASSFKTDELPPKFNDDCEETPRELNFFYFGETTCGTIEGFLRLTVNIMLEAREDLSKQSKLSLLQIPNGQVTSELCEALVLAIQTVTGKKVDISKLTPDRLSDCKDNLSVLVTGPVTLSEGTNALVTGLARMLIVWSEERLRPGVGGKTQGLAVLAEERLGGSWFSVVKLAASPKASATVLEVAAAGVPDNVTESILVWRGLPLEQIMDVVAEVDTKPYAKQARLVFLEDKAAPRFSLSEPLYAQQLALNARVNVLTAGGRWGCWRTLPVTKAVVHASSLHGVKIEYLGVNTPHVSGAPAKVSGPVDYVGVEGGSTRVMGIAQWLNQQPRPDAMLRWPVPDHWTTTETVSVPLVYSMAYHALLVKAAAQRNESILVHEGISALGQAAIRVATQLGCSPIFTTVTSQKQREQLLKMFPKLEPAHVLVCSDSSFEFRLRVMTGGQGVRIVFNTLTEMHASMRCLSHWGRLLQFRREDMMAARTIGTQDFLKSITIFGVSGSEVLLGSARDRKLVAEAVSKGLADGVVKPIVAENVLQGITDSETCEEAAIQLQKVLSSSKKHQYNNKEWYIIMGAAASETLQVASQLSVLGARNILAAVPGSVAVSALARQRQSALLRQHGTQLQLLAVRSWDAGAVRQALQSAATLGPVHTVLVVNKHDVELASLVDSVLDSVLDSAALAVLGYGAVSAKLAVRTERRRARGKRTACLVAPAGQREAAHLADLLSAAARGATGVTVLPDNTSTAAQGAAGEAVLSGLVPRSPAALAALGGAMDSMVSPRLRELPSLGHKARHPTENAPLFVLPPFGVLNEQLTDIASGIFSSVIAVETPEPKDGIERLATVVLEAILRCRPHGPYNLMGWGPSTVLALEVQRQLEAANKCGVLFLVHGDVGTVRKWARIYLPTHCGQEAVMRKHGSNNEACLRGARAVTSILRAIANYEADVRSSFAGRVHVIKTSSEDQQTLNVNDPHVNTKTILETKLHTLALYVNEHSADSQLAGVSDLQLSVNSVCRI